MLADNGRLSLTPEVITAFGKMMSAHRGEVTCSVTTAQVSLLIFSILPADIWFDHCSMHNDGVHGLCVMASLFSFFYLFLFIHIV